MSDSQGPIPLCRKYMNIRKGTPFYGKGHGEAGAGIIPVSFKE